jgi:hypothetical protein
MIRQALAVNFTQLLIELPCPYRPFVEAMRLGGVLEAYRNPGLYRAGSRSLRWP